jgi:3-oxoacyl-[acyl-carrier protein] reductase
VYGEWCVDASRAFFTQVPGFKEQLLATTPLGRLGLPADIGAAVSLFASEQSRWITGQELLVTGGLKD